MRVAGLLLVLACVSGAGCVHRRPSVTTIVKSLTPPRQIEGLVVESVLVEQPLGDTFIDRDLWTEVTPVGSPETRVLLDENGLRVGVVSGTGPQKLQTLLGSETDTVSPQLTTFQMRKDTVLPTATPPGACQYEVRTDLGGRATAVELTQARCGVLVRPQQTADGRVRVWCEPQVQHGDRKQWLRPNEDGTKFAQHNEVPTEKYAALGVEATLGPDDYLVLGWDAAAADTLGSVLFSADAGGRPRQRVLVIRARPATPQPPPDLPPITGATSRPSVAAQAASKK
ncbi:Uncharacterized protein OS=Planctomyces limnophilus (strain ATCC 43296 / DSM 3776 / IFAM 1008 / 290) GN=Plim_2225 PE=4 SV=1 [Gemmataceae bacterium]|nr:Uncharacterized protein OS=Planctomyces limnophilus (strain ATCC 43296 / DSM 3776 / IFAM 1008 / 290) GN=Plim_2225 PE=4 SV=1 [Gemmataceae bacterium]VTU00080.1 Uncharacterized protein OS=Planctomyces limnophilus (strain ATCC 43296 / DSM 3776 / IFAM 1008 / 290) GN=Plim_2225 PE=4 SV=1 [Gemmataceae bacterium]